MIITTEHEKKIKQTEVVGYKCDCCGKVFMHEMDLYECQEFFHIRHTGGFGSVFGDGDTVELDICQSCFKHKLGDYCRYSDETA